MDKEKGKKIGRIIGMAVGGVALAVLFAFAFGLVVQYLWNYLMPGLFGLQEITYWQAFAMVVLAKLLFGAIGSHHGGHDHDRHFGRTKRRACGDSAEAHGAGGEHARLYGDFWREEGQKAFEEYVRRVQPGGGAKNG